MPSFACPKCKKVLKTLNPLPAGKNIKCPACSQVFPAPAAATAQPTAVQANKPVAAPSPQQAHHPSRLPRALVLTCRLTSNASAKPHERQRLVWMTMMRKKRRRPKRRRKKKKAESQRSLILILSGVGVLVLLIVVAAFIWPGFLKSGNTKTVTKAAPGQARGAAGPVSVRADANGRGDRLGFLFHPQQAR